MNENHFKVHNLAYLLNDSIPFEGLISGFEYANSETNR